MIAQAVESTSIEDAYSWDGVHVRANMIVTLDGAVTGRDGTSGSLGTPTDRTVFSQLRRTSDAVLVGAGTFTTEQYRPITSGPALCVVSRSLGLDPRNPAFHEGTHRAYVLTCESAPSDRRDAFANIATVIIAGSDRVDLRSGVSQLRHLAGPRVLCEGGPQLLAAMFDQGVVDELCLSISAKTSGNADALRLLGGHSVRTIWRFTQVLWDADGVYARLTAQR